MATAGEKKLKAFLVVAIVFVVILGGSVALLVKYANKIIKGEMESRLGKAFSIERIDLKWGRVEAVGIKLKNAAGKEVIKVGDLSVKADFMGLLRKQYIISSVAIKDAYVFVEIDNKGNIVNPVLPPELTSAKPAKGEKPKQPGPPITIKKIEIINGSIDYLDRKTPVTPVLTKLRNVDFVIKDVSVPFIDTFSNYVLSANIPGNMSTGTIKSNGKIKFKTKDMNLKTDLRKLDITSLKPYFQKESPVNITKGFLDLDMNVKVVSQKIHAPGTAVLKDLEFASGSGIGSKFMGVPLSLVVASLKKSNNEIPVNFVIEGDLNNPKFDLKENLMGKILVAMAEKLGLPIKGITEAVAGAAGEKGAEKVGSGIKGIGENLKNIFKK
jgi:hypothetical protein